MWHTTKGVTSWTSRHLERSWHAGFVTCSELLSPFLSAGIYGISSSSSVTSLATDHLPENTKPRVYFCSPTNFGILFKNSIQASSPMESIALTNHSIPSLDRTRSLSS
ncbi:hypothetical protein PsorP6_018870 [Peronosclerospora sorghi]|nr:hypothetical protein PsorP6_018870 [Peronosclerospora sorghi]